MSTFLFTDIEGSTEKWEKYKKEMGEVLSRHDAILSEEIEKHKGKIIKHTGDGIFAVFEDGEPLQCAIEIQKRIANEDWGVIGELRIRIGLHAGIAERRGDDYFGPVVNRTARVMAAGWGGQIVVTREVKNIAPLPDNATFKDLGTHLLKDLIEPQQLLGLVHPDISLQDFPPLRTLSSHHHNLPIQATPFLGRQEELKDIIKLIENPSCRLITLIGPGGIGKTRLAIQAAAERIEKFQHGVYFVPLDPLSSAEFLVSTIAEALKFSFYSKEDEKVQLLNYLREKQLLLILDNFEHLVEGAGIIAEILNTAPDVKIMVTSRELLNLRGEWLVQVGGMKVPKGEQIDVEGFSAVQLFLQSAQRVRTDVILSDEDKRYVVHICQLVGGLPLGIEIASSWLRSLSCKEIAQEIEKNLDFLATSMRDVPERHRSLRAVFDYSWNLLSEEEKAMFMRASVFRGSFTREAAEKVAGISLPVLTTLMDKSLMRRNPDGRFEMQDIIRQFAEGKLNDFPEEKKRYQDSHCEFYANFLSDAETVISKNEDKEILEAIRRDMKNIREAWNWAMMQGRIREIEKCIAGLSFFHEFEGWFQEGLRIFSKVGEVLREKKDDDEIRKVYGRIIAQRGNFYFRLSRYDEARKILNESIGIFDSFSMKREKAFSLLRLSRIDAMLSEYESAKTYGEESLQLNTEIGYKKGIANSLNVLGVIHFYTEDFGKAREYYEESHTISKELGFKKGIATAECNIGLILYELGNYDEAIRLLEGGLKIDKELDNVPGMANTIHNLGLIYKVKEEYAKAREYYEKALKIRREIGDRMGVAISLNNLGNLGGRSVDNEEGVKFHQEALQLRREMGDKVGVSQSLNNMANLFSSMGKHKEAKELYHEALVGAMDSKERFIIRESLMGIANYLSIEGKKRKSCEVLSFLRQYGKEDEDLVERVEEEIEGLKGDFSAEEFNEIQETSKEKKLEDVVGEIISQLMDFDLE
jgi:predicted ATPase